MNKLYRSLVIGLSILIIGNSLHAVEDATQLLTRYRLQAERYANHRAKTETFLYTALAIGSTTAAALMINQMGHIAPMESILTALPVGGSTVATAQLFGGRVIRKLARWINTDGLLFSGLRSRKLNTQAAIRESIAKGEFNPILMCKDPAFSNNQFITNFLGKIIGNNQQLRAAKDIIPTEKNVAGGYEREMLEVILHMTAPERATALRLKKPHGILIHGPAGTGKTLKSTQIAAMAQVAMKNVVVGELKDKWQGGSEQNIRDLFADARNMIEILEKMAPEEKAARARKQQIIAAQTTIQLDIMNRRERAATMPDSEAKTALIQATTNIETQLHTIMTALNQQNITPQDRITQRNNLLRLANMAENQEPEYHPCCIVFIDEIDAFGSRAESRNGSDVSNGMITQLLGQMDGADKDKNKDIIVIGTTNQRNLLDPAILRQGRFDKEVYLGIPETAEQRLSYLKFFGGASDNQTPGIYSVDRSVREHYQEITAQTERFSQADLDGLFKKAGDNAMVANSNLITWDHMQPALEYMVAKKADELAASEAQECARLSTSNLPVTQDRRLAFLRYYGSDNHYQAEPDARTHFNAVAQENRFFSPVDIHNTFQTAVSIQLANRQDDQRISWATFHAALLRVRAQKLRLLNIAAIPGEQHAQPAADVPHEPVATQGQQAAEQPVPAAGDPVAQQPAEINNPAPEEAAPVVQPTAVNDTAVPGTPVVVVNEPQTPAINNQEVANEHPTAQTEQQTNHPAPETVPVVQPTAVNNTTVPETPIVVNKPPAPAVNNQAAPVQQQDQPAVPAVQQVPQQNIVVQPEPAIPANPLEAVPPLPYDEELELTEYRQMQQNEHCTIL